MPYLSAHRLVWYTLLQRETESNGRLTKGKNLFNLRDTWTWSPASFKHHPQKILILKANWYITIYISFYLIQYCNVSKDWVNAIGRDTPLPCWLLKFKLILIEMSLKGWTHYAILYTSVINHACACAKYITPKRFSSHLSYHEQQYYINTNPPPLFLPLSLPSFPHPLCLSISTSSQTV